MVLVAVFICFSAVGGGTFNDAEALEYCERLQVENSILPCTSWGNANGTIRTEWLRLGCDDVLRTPCSQAFARGISDTMYRVKVLAPSEGDVVDVSSGISLLVLCSVPGKIGFTMNHAVSAESKCTGSSNVFDIDSELLRDALSPPNTRYQVGYILFEVSLYERGNILPFFEFILPSFVNASIE